MKIATWNVNSIKAHLDAALAWAKDAAPDVICFQELKCEDHAFPAEPFEALGYSCTIHGQKTYNGVGILSKLPVEDVLRGLPGNAEDDQARFVQCTVFDGTKTMIVAAIYLPNGNPAPGPKYDYKLAWMERLERHASALLHSEQAFVITGDYNVIPAAEDAKKPDAYSQDALYLPETRSAFTTLKALGLTEAHRNLYPLAQDYTYWDYQAGAWQKNNGIRIDHGLLSPQAADRLVNTEIHKHVRGWEKPSDHVPVVFEFT